MTSPTMKAVFLEAADTVRPLLDVPALSNRWHDQSALERLSIGALTAHLSRAVTVVIPYLERPGAGPFRDPAAYFLTFAEQLDTDLDSVVAVAVRDRAVAAAEPGLTALAEQWDQARSTLEALGPEREHEGITVLGGPMRLGAYLVTRTVELVVHGDDLAASLGEEPPKHSPDVYATVLGCLVEIASRRSSPLDVIRAMTRLERSQPEVLRVF